MFRRLVAFAGSDILINGYAIRRPSTQLDRELERGKFYKDFNFNDDTDEAFGDGVEVEVEVDIYIFFLRAIFKGFLASFNC